MKLCTLSTFAPLLVVWICTWSTDGQPCLHSRLERVPCPLRPALPKAGINQYAIYRSRIRPGSSGHIECRLRGRHHVTIRNISTLGTNEVRLLFSPGSQLYPRQNYANEMLMMYNIRCNDDEEIFYNITWQDVQPRNCGDPPVCADYIQVIRSGGFGVTESCGNDTGSNARQLEEQEITVRFRTSEVDEFPGFEMYVICYKPEERDLPGCTRVKDGDVTASDNDADSGEGTGSRHRRSLQKLGFAEERVLMELMQSQFAQLTPADDVIIVDPELPTILGDLDYLQEFSHEKRQTDNDRKFDATAVRTAITNENACNPILRASTRSVLTVNTRINRLRVREIRERLRMVPTQPPTTQQTRPTLGTVPTTQTGNPDISVECEAATIGFIKAVDQLFYPSVSGSIRKLSIWINPNHNHETMYRVRIYHSLVPGTNLIASSNIVTLGPLSPSTQAQFYDFTFPSSVNLDQGDGYIWNLECLSGYCGAIARCSNTIQRYEFRLRRPGEVPQTNYDYSFKLYI